MRSGTALLEYNDMNMYEKPPSGYYGQDVDAMYHPMLNERQVQQHAYQHRQRSASYQQNRRPVRQMKKSKRSTYGSDHWLIILVDPVTQQISCESSEHFEEVKDEILSPAVKHLDSYLRRSQLSDKPQQHESVPGLGGAFATNGRAKSSNKRRRAGTDRDVSDSGSQKEPSRLVQTEESDTEENAYVRLRVDETAEWEKWFYNAFRAVQQVSCRVIAKEWIKTIHPKKQSTHPYNGKNPRTGERGDSASTKPPYWPKDVIHREPDHINKEARTKLLVHLLMNTPHQEMSLSGDPKSEKTVNAEALKNSLEQKKLESGMSDLRRKFSIVEQIIEMRSRLEQYEAGGLDANAVLQVTDYTDYMRPSKTEDESDEIADDKVEILADEDNSEQQNEDDDFVLGSQCKQEMTATQHTNHQLNPTQTANTVAEDGQRSKTAMVTERLGHHSTAMMPQQQQQLPPPPPPIGHSCVPMHQMYPTVHPPMVINYTGFGSHLCPIHEDVPRLDGPYAGFPLGPSMNGQMDMSSHPSHQDMIPPNMVPTIHGSTYLDPSYSSVAHHHPPFSDPNHAIHFLKQEDFVPTMEDQRNLPYRDHNQHYGNYLMSPTRGSDMIHAPYLSM